MRTTSPSAVYPTVCYLCHDGEAADPKHAGLCLPCYVVMFWDDIDRRVRTAKRAIQQRGRRIMDGWVTCQYCMGQSSKPEEHVCPVVQDVGDLFDVDDAEPLGADLATVAAD